jgi:membrane protein implicated in regulation of membrane protease activity
LKVTLVALILALVAVALLAFSDALHPWVPVGLLGAQIALLLSIPISLALFAFLAHRRAERLKTEEKQEQKPD